MLTICVGSDKVANEMEVNMKKGFTLVEMIAVVMIIALISVIALPTVVNQLGERKQDVSDKTIEIIFQATELYMKNKPNTYPAIQGSRYCVQLEELVNSGSLSKPVIDYSTGNEISLAKWACVEVDSYSNFSNLILEDKNKTS